MKAIDTNWQYDFDKLVEFGMDSTEIPTDTNYDVTPCVVTFYLEDEIVDTFEAFKATEEYKTELNNYQERLEQCNLNS